MTVLILTDSTASWAPEEAARYGVRIVPVTVVVNGRAYRDTELDPAALTGVRATTSGPPPGDFLAALRDASDGAVIVTVAAALSSTSAAARAAAGLSDQPVEVVDSGSAAGGLTLVALAAADRARRHGQVAEVAAAARTAASQVRLVGFLHDLDGLARTGRVPGLAATAARSTRLQFMFTLHNGVIRPLRPASGRAAAIGRTVDLCVSTGSAGAVLDVVILGRPPGVEQRLADAARAGRFRLGSVISAEFTTAITLYTGPHVMGLAWRWHTPTPPGGLAG